METMTETMKQTAREVQRLHPEIRADEIWAVVQADPSLDVAGVIGELETAAQEHAANVAAERGIRPGARVQAGEGEDHDTGRVVQIGGEYDGRTIGANEAVIAWDSGVRTPADLSSLTPE